MEKKYWFTDKDKVFIAAAAAGLVLLVGFAALAIVLGVFLYQNPSKGPGELEIVEVNPKLDIVIEEKYQHESHLVRNQYEIIDGILYGTGRNESGQLGVPPEQSRVSGMVGYVASPVLIAKEVKYATVGLNTVMYLTEEGQVYVLGNNKNGQLGPARGEMDVFNEEISMKTKYSHEPVLVMDHVVFISSGLYTLAAISDEGKLYMWGDNSFGEIGNGNRGEGLPTQCKYFVTEPYLVKENIKDVWFEEFTVYAVNYWDEVYAWGSRYGTTPQKTSRSADVAGNVADLSSIVYEEGEGGKVDEVSSEGVGINEEEQRKSRPSREEVLAKRKQVFAGMSDEAVNRMISIVAKANLELEHEYLYGDFFSNLEDPGNLTWNLFHETGLVQTGWAVDGDLDYRDYSDQMTEEEFYKVYGMPVTAYNDYTADDFIRIMKELRDSTGSDMLVADFDTMIREMELAREDYNVRHIFNIYYLLHDMDYFLLRYGPEDVGKYTWDDSTVTAYYGVLKVYEDDRSLPAQ
ncbi:MAG: hypothetical protein IJP31_06685 [Lachnospiraceae bacterium]|nr:hypothetical protein [Lachnospiraceae bacterium]